MKKAVKKLFAGALALTMVFSVTPFTGLTLLADEAETEAPAATSEAETEKPKETKKLNSEKLKAFP